MFDKLLTLHALDLVADSLEQIEKRSAGINSADEIFRICKEDIPLLYQVINRIRKDLIE